MSEQDPESDAGQGRQPQGGSEPAESPEPDHTPVTRLLAATAHRAGTPPDVTARLDDVLSALVAERETSAQQTLPGRVPPRRRWPGALVAAAAVAAIALGVGTVMDSRTDQHAASSADAGADAEAGASTDESGPEPGASTAVEDGGDGSLARMPRPASTSEIVRLRATSLAEDLRPWATGTPDPPPDGLPRRACVRPTLEAGDEWLRARLDGRPAVVVLRAPAGGRRTAAVFTCDGGPQPAATATVPAR